LAKARVRGVYSTALTKLLLDHGFDIVQPSVAIKERFGLEERDESPDLDIDDRRDRQGVRAFGNAEAINAFKSILQSCLDDVVTRKWTVGVDGTYKGLVKGVDPVTHSVLVDIGPAIGRIAEGEVLDPNTRQVVVQVDRVRTWTKEPILTTRIRIPGKYAILIPGRRVRISRKIRDGQKRSRLHRLGEELALQDWGILWRTASADQPSDVLRNEIARLVKEGEAIRERAERVEAPATLREGNYFMDVEFPASSKKKLDEVRGSVAPTMDGHHYYKACGGEVSSALDMAEKLLEKGCPRKEVKDLFEETIEAEYPTVGSTIEIMHAKLDGKVFHLGTAVIEAYDHDKSLIRFRRVFKGEGFYDGLRTRKEPGDHAVTEAKIGGWHFKTWYFSRDGRHKGTYINLNTPIELYPYGIRYVDLEADVCIWPDGRVKVLDEEKLDNAVAEGLVTEKLIKIVREKLQEIMKDTFV
jgi:Ribonuclease G/E